MRVPRSNPHLRGPLIVVAMLLLLPFAPVGAFAQSGGFGAYFTSVTDYQGSDDSFKQGYAAGTYDAVSLFATAMRQSGNIDSRVVSFYQCLNDQGDKLGQVKTWVDSAVAHPSSDKDAVVVLIAQACSFPFSGTPTNFEEMYQYSTRNDSFKTGYTAGVFDATSVFALSASRAGIDNQKTQAVFQCLDSLGDRIVQVEQWIDTALAKTSSLNTPAFLAMVNACTLASNK